MHDGPQNGRTGTSRSTTLSLQSIRRATSLAVAAAVLATGVVLADGVQPDGDLLMPGAQGVVDLGAVAPGTVINHEVGFTLFCGGLRHVDPGQTVTVSQGATVVPAVGGSIATTAATIGPVPASWVNDQAGPIGCPSALRLAANGPSTVTIVAPPVPGLNYLFTVLLVKSLSPAGVFDSSSVTGPTALTFIVDVVDADTTPPVLHDVPAGLELFTSDPGGVVLDYALPTATDDRDPAPSVACVPPPGDLAPVGASSVTCTATDATGNSASATFPVLVHLTAVLWDEPVGEGSWLMVHGNRTIPVKLRAWLDGVPVTVGAPELVVSACGDSLAATMERSVPVSYQVDSARWMGHLATAGLAVGCHRVELSAGGVTFGAFSLELMAASSARSGASARRS